MSLRPFPVGPTVTVQTRAGWYRSPAIAWTRPPTIAEKVDNDCSNIAAGSASDHGDFIKDPTDNCPTTKNPGQTDLDADGQGDECDTDDDGDGVPEVAVPPQLTGDNCPGVPNPDQLDADFDRIGAACDPSEDGDLDNDDVPDANDNCPLDYNPREIALTGATQIGLVQPDSDGDGEGDACDPDMDGDGVGNNSDNCVSTGNADQGDADGDGLGDQCDACPASADSGVAWGSTTVATLEGDVVLIKPVVPDMDGDGIPDACDHDGFGSDVTVAIDGNDWDIGLMPRPDGVERRLAITGEPRGWVDLPLLLCDLICEPTPPSNTCGELEVSGLADGLHTSVVDDLGFAVGAGRADGSGDLRFRADGGRSYMLRVALGSQFSGSVELTVRQGRCTTGDGSGLPFKEPPSIGSQSSPAPPAISRATTNFTVNGTPQELTDGFCEMQEVEGSFVFALTFNEVGDHYFSIVLESPEPIVDGTYGPDLMFSTLEIEGVIDQNIEIDQLTLTNGTRAGTFTAHGMYDPATISGTFVCG